MKYLAVVLMMALTGCGVHNLRPGGGHNLYGTSTYGNRDYARNCGAAMDELLMCGGYVSPHTF